MTGRCVLGYDFDLCEPSVVGPSHAVQTLLSVKIKGKWSLLSFIP